MYVYKIKGFTEATVAFVQDLYITPISLYWSLKVPGLRVALASALRDWYRYYNNPYNTD
jgi:hypothetical protein